MKFRRVFGVLALVMALMAGTVAQAQEPEIIEPIPACNEAEYTLISGLFVAFNEDYAVISDTLQEADATVLSALLPLLLIKTSELQQSWWGLADVLMPRCTMGYEVRLIVGRLIDETMISMALLSAGEFDIVDVHIEAISEVSEEMGEMAEELTELAAQQ